MWRKFWKNQLLVGISIGLLAALIASFAFNYQFELLRRWQWSASDFLFLPSEPGEQIVIVGVDEQSLKALGRWPWSRDIHAQLLEILAEAKPRVIGLDLLLTESTTSENDTELAGAIRQAGNVVLPQMATRLERTNQIPQARKLQAPIPIIAQASAGIGHVNVIPSGDNIVRKFPPLIKKGADWQEAFSLRVLREYLNLSTSRAPVIFSRGSLSLGDIQIPIDAEGYMLINYAGRALTFPMVSYLDVLNGKINQAILKDKIVLVGVTAMALGESLPTPVSGQPMYGVEIHANAIHTILNQRFLTEQSREGTILILLFLALLCGLVLPRLRALRATFFSLSLVVLYVLIALFMRERGVIFNLIYPPLTVFWVYAGALAYNRIYEEIEKHRVTALFGRYVKPEIVRKIIATADEDVVKLRGVRQEVTILFADICGFTALSEDMNPEDVVALLNEYLTLMSKVIFKHDGTLDKYMGDCVMAFFNAPHPQDDHALRAARAAIEIQEQSKASQDRDNLPPISCGIGINTGEAVIGNIGGQHRLDYTAIGDTINLASRLCGAAGPGQILIAPSTYDIIKDAVVAQELGPMRFKGKKNVITVYNIQGLSTGSDFDLGDSTN